MMLSNVTYPAITDCFVPGLAEKFVYPDEYLPATLPVKLSGFPTRVPMPAEPVYTASNYADLTERQNFTVNMAEKLLFTLAYSEITETCVNSLSAIDLEELVIEIFPDYDNEFLGRSHGRQSVYISGCRGPLCRAANSVYWREYHNRPPRTVQIGERDETLQLIAASYLDWLKYIKTLQKARAHMRHPKGYIGPLWSTVELQTSILIDCMNL